jgi:hypothetical protein
VRAAPSVSAQGNEGFCGRELEGLQLICGPLGSTDLTESSNVHTSWGRLVSSTHGSPWRVFNVVMRLAGLLTGFFAVAGLFWGFLLVVRPPFLGRLHGVLTDPNLAPILLFAGLWFAIVAIGILRAPSYRPDLGDALNLVDPFGARLRRLYPPARWWWSGDPKAIGPVQPPAVRGHSSSGTTKRNGQRHDSVWLTLQKLAGTLLIGIGSATFVWAAYIECRYYMVMPRVSVPAAGRMSPIYIMHGLVYVTDLEAKTAHFASSAVFTGGFAMMCGIILVSEVRKRRGSRIGQ